MCGYGAPVSDGTKSHVVNQIQEVKEKPKNNKTNKTKQINHSYIKGMPTVFINGSFKSNSQACYFSSASFLLSSD